MVTLLVAAAACGSSQSSAKSSTASTDGSDDVCQSTAVTGTNITRVVCRTRAEADAERAAGEAYAREHSRNADR
ncbi:MAG TPA: hypothetical protein VFT22_02400 [Kofleriaceae bacterium]|nr:hypothetical protein [Kofleriaceae bacterium]